MRKILASQFITLDGVMDSPEKWNISYLSDAEVVSEILADFEASDAILFGKSSYQFFGARWPSRTGVMADKFNQLKKYVVSFSLDEVTWSNSTIIKSNVLEEIRRLKAQPGKNIILFGSHQLLQTLMDEDLVDAFKLYVYPLTLGSGKRMFEAGAAPRTLKLVSARPFASGVVSMTYHPIFGRGDRKT